MENTHLNRDVAKQMLAGLSGVQSEIEDGGLEATKAQQAFIAGGLATLETLLTAGDQA